MSLFKRAAGGQGPEFKPDEMPMGEWLNWNNNRHTEIVTYLKNRRKASEDAIAPRTPSWDEVDDLWQMHIDLDKPARRGDRTEDATARHNPFDYGIVIPASYSASIVRLTQMIAQFTARDPMTELKGVGPEDVRNAYVMEASLAFDHRQSRLPLVLWSLCQDAERYGLAVLRDSWEEERGRIVEKPMLDPEMLPPQISGALGRFAPKLFEPRISYGVKKEYVRYRTVNPRQYWGDPSYSICDVQRGQWAGHRESISVAYIEERLEERGEGDYFNFDRLRDILSKVREENQRKDNRQPPGTEDKFDEFDPTPAVVDHLEVKIVPRRLGLGPSEREEKWVFEIVNDEVVIKAHPAAPWHDQFGYSVAEVNPDPHVYTNLGGMEMTAGLQWYIDLLINADIQAKLRRINGALVYAPEVLEEDDMFADNLSGNIRVTPWAFKKMLQGRLSSADWFRQLEMPNSTSDFVQTAMQLHEFMQRQQGSSDPAQGMPLPTKRTLGEVSLIAQNSSQRVAQVCMLIDEAAIAPTVARHIALRQQFTSMGQYVRITGELATKLGDERLFVKPYDLWGNFDYTKVSAVRPNDPARDMQTWVQVAQIIAQFAQMNPMLAQGVDWVKVIGEIVRTAGIRNFDRFLVNPAAAAGAQVLPDEQVAQMAAQGQAMPVAEEQQVQQGIM